MMLIEDLKTEIESLPRSDFESLRRWIEDRDWDSWDEQIEEDDANGKLDFLIAEALAAKNQGKLREL